MKKIGSTILTMLFLLSGACTDQSRIDSPSAIHEGRLISGDVLFSDDFSDSQQGWETWNDEHVSGIEISNGSIHIKVNQQNTDIWTTPNGWYNNTRIEVAARKISGENDNIYGLICRKIDNSNYYAFLISSDGYFGVMEVNEGNYSWLHANQMTFHEGIFENGAVNRLRADCTGPWLVFYINGNKVAEIKNLDFTEGDVGLIAGTTEQADLDISFDDFIIYVP